MALKILFLTAIFFIHSMDGCFSQNLEAIGKSNPLKVNGGVSANQIFYATDGINNRRSPYQYFLSGNLNFSLYEFNVPLSFHFSNQNISFQQPFNQLSLHPVYKWVTGHIGFASMTFSPYTLNGHLFKGIGVDVSPNEKIKISAMYGRLLRAVLPDTVNNQSQPSFARHGYGTKVSYNSNGNFLELSVFCAKDDLASLPHVPEAQNVLPQENLALSAAGGLKISKKIQLKYEYANSAITSDTRADRVSVDNFYSYVGSIFIPRISTAYYNAMKGCINYNGSGFAFGAGYERVDPQYKTLGAYFFNNDLESITVNGAKSFFGGKISLTVSAGTQRDNLDKSKISTMRRAITSIAVAGAPNTKVSVNATYSNFQTFTNIRSAFVSLNQLTPYDNLDTLRYTQISQNANATISYSPTESKKKRKNLFMSINFMKATDTQTMDSQNSGSTFFNFNAGYSVNLVDRKLTITPTFNLATSESHFTKSVAMGPSFAITKTLNQKLRITTASNANRVYTEGKYASQVITVRAMFSYVIKKKHNLNLSCVGLSRDVSSSNGEVSFNEFTATVGYSYSF